jgi:hypothetical protein
MQHAVQLEIMAKRTTVKRVAAKKPARKQKPKHKPDWARRFLAAIIEGLHVRDACAKAKTSGCMPYQRRRTDEAFAAAWKEASDIGTEALEAEAARRAYHGTLRPVFHAGEQCGLIREYSDQLLQFLLRSRKPATYRETYQHEHSGPGGKGIQVEIVGIEVVPPATAKP